jgi:glycosyltransferase involved in cell wall biosynthesis
VVPRILVVHNRYRSEFPSGENQVVDGQIALLRGAGLEVETYVRSSDEIAGFSKRQRVELGMRPIFSREDVTKLDAVIERFRPDVVHLHHVYPLISPAVVLPALARGCRVVQTVHNFRHICVSGSLFRDGATCTECVGKRVPWPAVVHGCYRDSRAQTVVQTTALAYHRKTWSQIDRFLPVSEFVAEHLERAGIPRAQLAVVPNSVPDPGPAAPIGNGLLFVGRLDDQKGVGLLLDAWERCGLGRETTLTLVGDGPERATVEQAAFRLDGVRYCGPATPDQIVAHMRASRAVVVPPIGFEALPTVVLESYASGRPVVATRVGPMESLVPPDTGWLASPDAESLAGALTASCRDEHAEAMARRAREAYLARYAPDAVLARLVGVYQELLAAPRETSALGSSPA